jgi:signal transduction histidine kinase
MMPMNVPFMTARTFICLLVLLVIAGDGTAREDRTRSRETVIVGGNSAYPPYEFLDEEGRPAGFVVELTRAIAETMGFAVEIKLGQSWTDMRKALENGEVDVLQGISYSKDREKILDFSPPHSFVSHSIFARKDAPAVYSLDELQGKEVVVMGRGVMHDYFVQAGLQIQPVPAPTVADAIRLLTSGQYDYAVVATLPGLHIIKSAGIRNVEIVAKSIDTKEYCYAVKKGNFAVLAKFNEGFSLLKQNGRYRELQDKWLGGADTSFVLWSWLAKYSAVIVLSLILGLGITISWSRILNRQVAIRTAALEREIEVGEKAAEELKRRQQQLVQAGKMAALGVLVSGMAHEINNPNGLILLNLPLITDVLRDIDPILDAHYRERGDFKLGGLTYSRMRSELPLLLDETQEAAKRIKRIVDDLKQFSRKSDADFKELVDLNNVVRTSLRLVDNTLRRSTNNYRVHYAEPLPKVKGNSHRLEQVIVNLLLNSCQALEGPGKGIFVTTSHDRKASTVLIEVRDEGSGIPPEHLSRLTDPFFTTKRDTGGTGLGLAISAEIVREHGGAIRFESASGKGTTVVMTLPAATEEARS